MNCSQIVAYTVPIATPLNVVVKLKKERNKFCETGKGFAEDHLELYQIQE